MALAFRIVASDGPARAGVLKTAHGPVRTPAFMPVGTAATVKAMTPEALKAAGTEIVLGNTYHLMLRPGAERIERLGGLHRFMNWPGPILTDSGGFQVMSMSAIREIEEAGVTFRSHLDGSLWKLTPEGAVEVQRRLRSDITLVLDECTPHPIGKAEAAESMRRSMRWAERSKRAFEERSGFGLFGINQGGVFEDLRAESAERLGALAFDGYAVGGLSVGEGQAAMLATLDKLVPLLPAEKPRHLMGVGRPEDIIGAVERGIDLFDCVLPTRSGRMGQAFTHRGALNIRNARHAEDARPLDAACDCPTCARYSRAYLNHLFRCEEILGAILLTWHNLHFYQELMRGLREAIEGGALRSFAQRFEEGLETGDVEPL